MTKMPKNSIGLPEAIYRTDLVPEPGPELLDGDPTPNSDSGAQRLPMRQDTAGGSRKSKRNGANGSNTSLDDPSAAGGISQSLDGLSVAFLPLSYAEGYPTLPNGMPFWDRFDFEPAMAFQAFEAYVIQGDQGARQLFLLEQSKDIKATTAEMLDWFDLYYWESRSKAYDLFKIAQARKVRQIRALHTEDKHYLMSARLMSILQAYMLPDDKGESEFIQELTPKAAIDLLKTLAQMQRVSAGLPASGPAPYNPADPGGGISSIDVIMRSIVQQGSPVEGPQTIDEEGNTIEALDEALQDPHVAALAQELIIKLNTKPPKQAA